MFPWSAPAAQPLNYRPGESIFSYLSYYVRADAKLTARGVSEVEQLDRSTCKRTSGDQNVMYDLP